ncbi:hypothetical protein [Salinarimonas soli]|uniref:Uncharacterized protein n=1 Tax=Salinarimonas soli TaxID=1638099 RepID=A0A5B2V7G8_9HYPH|nr:hypothetical protein [Salinarimonas soli]KAA2235463.1 hypothetical protein F0L46_19780 [Salinarimonas soli]
MTQTSGIAQAWSAARGDQREQAMELLALKMQAGAERGLVKVIEEAAPPPSGPPAPEGQGTLVDRRV